MKPKARFIKSIIATAKTCDTQMPWTRSIRKTAARAAENPRRLSA